VGVELTLSSEEDRRRRALLRIVDANRNRALEALRVVEEHARFVLAAEGLATKTKDLRHRVHLALAHESMPDLALHRDVSQDPLRPAEASEPAKGMGPRALRQTTEDVAHANLARAKEALRSLEEYVKPLAGQPSAELERIRYAVYALEKDILHATRVHERLHDRPVYVLLEAKDGRPPLAAMARAALAGGARLFQYREKRLTDRERLAQARELARIVQGEGGLFLVNDRADVALLSKADGVHVGQTDLAPADARRVLAPGAIVGSSAHDAAELAAALASGVDYMGVGTVFASPTKPELGEKGLAVLRDLVPRSTVPVYAIGGITAANAASAIEAGAAGVAVSSSVLDGVEIGEAVRRLDAVVRAALEKRS
jgi:thiamine-phosphate pyrophosphorylase